MFLDKYNVTLQIKEMSGFEYSVFEASKCTNQLLQMYNSAYHRRHSMLPLHQHSAGGRQRHSTVDWHSEGNPD